MAATANALNSESTNSIVPDAWTRALQLPCQLTVEMPIPNFRTRNVLALQKHSLVNSHWRVGADVPLLVNGRLIAQGEFEVVGNNLAVRLVDLAADEENSK